MTALNSHAQVVAADSHEPKVHAATHQNGGADEIDLTGLSGLGTAAAVDIDTDGTLAANSDAKVATQKAVKTYVGTAVTGLLDFKGATDCSANPNYPAASKGDAYVVSVAGKIGGASGTSADVGDVFVASADNAGGTQAGVGTSWFILEHNLAGAYVVGGTDVAVADGGTGASTASAARTNLGLVIATDVEAHDADLTAIAGLSPSNDDVIQRKAGAWTNRTMAQLASDLGVSGSGNLAGTELDYVQVTSDVNVTTVDGGGFDTVITGGSVAYDGSTIVMIEFYANAVQVPSTASNNYIYFVLFDGATQLGNLSISLEANSASIRVPMFAARRLTPSNATHQYLVKAAIGAAGTGVVRAGDGASGHAMPAFMRITRVSA